MNYPLPTETHIILTFEMIVDHPQLGNVSFSLLSGLQIGMEHTHQVEPHPLAKVLLHLDPVLKDLMTKTHDVSSL